MSVVRHLLPGNVVPVHYDLEFCPDLDSLVYSGAAIIDVVVTEDGTNIVTFHSKELHLHSASFKSGEKDLKMTTISYNVAATEVTITFDENLPKGNGKLDIKFSGILNGDMAGFYRSAYVDAQGKKKFMATTQFEAIDARRAFPCWDEPAHKCTFDISLVIPVELTGVSNMPEKEVVYLNAGYEHMSPYSYSNPNPSKTSLKRIRFFTSPKMSTYLVAFCVGEFDSVSKVSRDNVNVRVLCPPGRAKECNFSLDIAIKSLEFYNDFFQVPYPLPKLDMICITEFAMGAMENWGLVTYRETALMIDDEKASSQSKQRVAIVVAHELAHQWFGNLVTMAWWDGLWLNEGFAAFMEHFCIASVCPEYRIWDQFTTDALGAALRLDSLRSSHPVIVPIKHAEEVEQVFDAISYCKGSCVVNMVYSTLGADHFQAGLRNYFKKYAYQNTETPDLWREWSDVSGVDVAALMSTWTQVMGYPVVDVVSETWSENSVSVTLRQQWFLADGSLKSDESQPHWTIPLLFATKSTVSDKAVLMTEKVQAFTIPIEGSDDFVKINAGQKALIRVKHSMGMLQRLKPQLGLSQSALSDVDKASLLLDAYALVKAQLSSIDDLVFLLKGCNPQTNSLVLWNAYQAIFGALNLFFDEIQGSAKTHFDKFAKQFVKKGLDFIGWNSLPTDGHTDRLVRSAVIGLLDVFCWDEAGIVEECRRRFAALMRGEKHEVPAEYKTTLFKIILMNGGIKEYEQILETFTSTEDNQEKKYALFSLGSSLKPELKLRTLDWAIKSDHVKLQDFFYPIGAVANTKEGAELCWKYYKDNFSAVRSRLGKSSPSLMDAVIVNCTSRFCSEAAAQDIEAFFDKNPLPSNTRKIAQVLENMRANAKLVETIASSANLQSESAWF